MFGLLPWENSNKLSSSLTKKVCKYANVAFFKCLEEPYITVKPLCPLESSFAHVFLVSD